MEELPFLQVADMIVLTCFTVSPYNFSNNIQVSYFASSNFSISFLALLLIDFTEFT